MEKRERASQRDRKRNANVYLRGYMDAQTEVRGRDPSYSLDWMAYPYNQEVAQAPDSPGSADSPDSSEGMILSLRDFSSNNVESLGKALEDEKIVSELALAEKDALSAKLRKEKQTRIAAEVERDALRSIRVATNAEKDAALSNLSREKELRVSAEIERDALRAMRATSENEKVVFLGMKAIAEAERDALRGRLPLEWIDGYRQAMIDMGVPPPDWDSFSY
ncbi:hypothetical protein LWI29_001884 [Acer saccharum]|uniref:Uncharacterized protein n=1 Tax=Acer saccharum TaxID=4024 RepID=A0AA39RTU1_ACESA|nr:hypothetical protein LWI29_001884 [Acer saccharum]